jgi:hypothetical protein
LTIPPRGSNTITLGVRSYGQCANGSCSETILKVMGSFAQTTRPRWLRRHVAHRRYEHPRDGLRPAVNDWQSQRIPDALDISSRRSADQNFNALPDECEQAISVPIFSCVAPTNPCRPRRSRCRLPSNGGGADGQLWANGSSLTRTQFFGTPFWPAQFRRTHDLDRRRFTFWGETRRAGLSSFHRDLQRSAAAPGSDERVHQTSGWRTT